MDLDPTPVCSDCPDDPELDYDEDASGHNGNAIIDVYHCPECGQTGKGVTPDDGIPDALGILDYK